MRVALSPTRRSAMRPLFAFFAGIGTVFAALAIGFGGALVVTGANDPTPRSEPTKLEQRTVGTAPVQATTVPEVKSAEVQPTNPSISSSSQAVASSPPVQQTQ